MITVCGEALVDLVSVDGRHYTAHPGGSPANVAVGLARLGVDVSLLARVSDDAFGRLLRDHLTGNGVDGRDLVPAAEPTTLAVATVGDDGSATYDFYVEGTADWQWAAGELPERVADDVTALHTGSMALEMAPGATEIESLLRREHHRDAVTISYDPNIRLARRGDRRVAREQVERLVGLADLVKVSSEDLAWLLPGVAPQDVARDWSGRGPGLVVATLGADGAIAVGPDGEVVTARSPRVDVVDTVGAGDAFMAGLLSGCAGAGLLGAGPRDRLAALDPAQLKSLLARAGTVAALTCGRAGADPPSQAELAAATAPAPI